MVRKNYINVIAQQFYGNRTCTNIHENEIDYFLRGILCPELFPNEDKAVARKFVRIPHSDYIVIVYDQNQEDAYVNAEFPCNYVHDGERYRQRWGEELKMHVSCAIPEIEFEIHTRCFACRINSSGELENIRPEDYSVVALYFSE